MRPAGNFNPEWGYIAPAPSFMRTLRIAIVAGAVGASAGAAVVFSLVERPGAEESVASRTLVQATAVASVQVPSAPGAPTAPVNISAPRAVTNADTLSPPADELSGSAAISHPAPSAAAVLADSATASDARPVEVVVPAAKLTATSLDKVPAQKKPAKRARVAPRYGPSRYDQALRGSLALLPLSGARALGGDYYGQRGEF
jgi:hypothetical protein